VPYRPESPDRTVRAACEQQKEARGMTMQPSRPAAIRYIVHNSLLKQERKRPA
jgi:hypothetical protein